MLASNRRRHQVVVLIKIDGCHWGFVQQDGLGLLKILHALVLIFGARGQADQLIVTRVGPTGVVVTTFGNEHVQKAVGVIVIGPPSGAGDVFVAAAFAGYEDPPVLVAQGNVDV